MSALCGVVRLDGGDVDPGELRAMSEAIRSWGADRIGLWSESAAGLAQLVAFHTPESLHERGPLVRPDGTVIAAAARLDNVDELCEIFGIGAAARAVTADSELVARAYERWSADAPLHLFGDWAFAAWHPAERRLFVARDHFGNTSLYYHRDGHAFAFASGTRALFALPHIRRRLNEVRLGQILTIAPPDGAATIHEGVLRLPPAHALTLTASGVAVREYWRMDSVPAVRLAGDADYIERFLELYDRAVRVRLRSIQPIAATLSAGLDSGSVTALAARELRKRGQRITALTSVPLYAEEAAAQLPGVLVDEWPLAHANAELQGNVDHIAVRTEGITPLQAIERTLAEHEEPEPGATNLHWTIALLDAARARGCLVLLSGQFGNGGVSWAGDGDRVLRALLRGRMISTWQRLREAQRHQRRSLLRAAWSMVVRPAQRRLAFRSLRKKEGWLAASGDLLRRDVVDRLQLFERFRASDFAARALASSRGARLAILLPGVTQAGALWHEVSATTGIEARDPTADVRLLEYCLGVPDDLYVRAEGDRWLIRKSMDGLLPPAVQWNARRGRQSADLLQRFRADAANVSAAVARVAASDRVRAYLDAGVLQRQWQSVVDPANRNAAAQVGGFAGALLVALFLDRFCD